MIATVVTNFGFFIIQSITFHNYQQLSAKDGIKA